MLGTMQQIAGAMAESGRNRTVSDPSTKIRSRRPTVGALDFRDPQAEGASEQLNAFRGTIYAAVDKIARRVAQLPVHLFEYEISESGQNARKEIFKHPFLTMFSPFNGRRPHEEYSVWELDYWTSISLDLTGEAWHLIERDKAGNPARITPLPANRMTVIFSEETGYVAGYVFTPKGAGWDKGIFIPKKSFEELRQRKNLGMPFIVQYRYPSPAGIEDPRGWSPVKAAAYAYDINLFEQVYKRTFLEQGAQLGGILQSEVALSKEQIDEYIDQFESRHRGVRKAGLPIVLPKMLKWTTTEPTPRDLQWVETMSATESMLLQIYGISDAKLGRADIGNRSTAEAMDVTFNREVIQSRLDVKKSKLNTDFLPIYGTNTDDKFLSVEFDDPVPADGELALKREDQDLKNQVITRNEVRKSRKLEPYGGKFGDAVYFQKNNIVVDPESDKIQNIIEPGAMEEYAENMKAKADAAAAKDKEGRDQEDEAVNGGEGGDDGRGVKTYTIKDAEGNVLRIIEESR